MNDPTDTVQKRSQRTHVSYIDRSRVYYAAKGFEQPYRWAQHDGAPFAPLAGPLVRSRVGVVTTSWFHPGEEPDGVAQATPKRAFAAPVDTAARATSNDDLFWAKDETDTDDVGAYLPVDHLAAMAATGVIGSVSPRFYGVPTAYSSRRTITRDAPKVLDWMREDDVDLALLIPL